MTLTAQHVVDAAARLQGVAHTTPLQRSERLSSDLGAEVYLKREDLQVVRSYKLRGAYNLIAQDLEAARASGVVCASAGNHAQGVAWAAQLFALDARIYVPATTPRQKRDRIAVLGGDRVQVLVVGETYDESFAEATKDVNGTGAVLVPAFDDLRTIAGQGTVAHEVVAQLGGAPDLFVAPVGGGGLLAGCATFLAPYDTRVIGAEPKGAASMTSALAAGHPVPLQDVDSFVDGAAVRTVGSVTFPLVQQHVAQVVTVDEGALCTEMLALYQSDGIIAEPAGALASAALPQVVTPGSTVVCVLSGGNNDISRYAEILERSLVHQGLKHYFLVEFPQEPGALRRFLAEVLGPDDDIALFEYIKRNNRETGPALVGLELARAEDFAPLRARMDASAMTCTLIEPNDPLFRFVL
ncbi:MAG: ilvA, partial [Frankiales bacterium]|nr:ilvA [Frankiales bacterium]